MKKICNFCGNKNIHKKTTDYFYQYNEEIMLFKNVPCEECEYCGEKYFEAAVLKKIEKEFSDIVIESKKKPKKRIKISVEEYIA
ncbi:MAG: type II toxin-antitoxin system MqsA family antitoxin [Spirochaetia bacterium]|nr:type II toxin-antitoxin system MqsA family antitoxin [Spirochaetia bacterium]